VSVCLGWQADSGIIAHRSDGFQRHVAGALDSPFIVLLEQDGADQSVDSLLIGEDANNVGAALDLSVAPLLRIGGVQLGRWTAGKSM
jgi:hypothetical protein